MLQVAAGRHVAAAMAAAALFLGPDRAAAQDTDPYDELQVPLDPSAPLDPLPDLGVEWPDMEEPVGPIAVAPDTNIAEAATERTYWVRIEGLDAADSQALIGEFQTRA